MCLRRSLTKWIGILGLFATSSAMSQEKSDEPTTQKEDSEELSRREKKVKAIEEGREGEPKRRLYAIEPEGKTLPKGLARFRFPFQVAKGSKGYNANGKKVDSGADVRVTGTALIIEYGLTNKLSLQLLAPYVTSNKAGLNAERFRKTATYQEKYDMAINRIASTMAATSGSACTTLEACRSLIENDNLALPTSTPIDLQEGEQVTLSANVPIKQQVDSMIVNAASQQSGAKGLGDIQLGGLYEVTDTTGPLHFSVGAGVRLPTGEFDVPNGQRAIGRGVPELGLRTNLDFDITNEVAIAWQHQFEQPLAKGKRSRAAIADPTKTLPGKKVDFERVGTRSVGFVYLKSGFGVISQVLDPYSFHIGYNYDYNNAVRVDGVETSRRSKLDTVSVALKADLVPYKVPLRFDYEHFVPVNGRNVAIAPTSDLFTMKAFYLF